MTGNVVTLLIISSESWNPEEPPAKSEHKSWTLLCAFWTCFSSSRPLQDLSNKDMKRDLYIISQVIRTGTTAATHTGGNNPGILNTNSPDTLPVAGRMLLNDSKKGPPHVQYRRPYGCAVLAMSDVLQTISELKEEKDFVLKVYTWVCQPTQTHTYSTQLVLYKPGVLFSMRREKPNRASSQDV